MRVAVITNMPAPYRVPCLNFVSKQVELMVFFCTAREPNRNWTVPSMDFPHVFLKENFRVKADGTSFVHNNKDVFRHLKAYDPDIVITGGFNPTMLYAFGYTLLHRKKHIPISDAWALTEQQLSAVHKTVRWLVFLFSKAFIACSAKGKSWYERYGLRDESIFVSPYTIDNDRFANEKNFGARKYDLLFSGQFTARKNPEFFARVAIRLQQQKKDLRVLLLGDGPLRESVLAELRSHGVNFDYGGQATQEELPAYYSDSKLFLFPTSNDAWGVVANEAAAAGTPVILSPYAGCADELIRNDENGHILPLEEDRWLENCVALLTDEKKWTSFSAGARASAHPFTHERSAASIIKACTFAGGSL